MDEADHPGFPGLFVPRQGPGTEARDCINGVDDEKSKGNRRTIGIRTTGNGKVVVGSLTGPGVGHRFPP